MNLAQLNIAKAKYPLDAPEIKEFVDNLEPINQLAERSEGFVWRLKDDSGDATSMSVFTDPNLIVNMSMWSSVDALKHFMFKTHHKDFLSRKKQWFDDMAEHNYVLWWVPVDHIPSIEEAEEKLLHLRQYGETVQAFTFKKTFKAP